MKTGGTVLPIELMIIHNVIIVPHSPATACPTCFVPSRATMLGDCTDVDTPVSSILYTLISIKFPRFKCMLIIVEIFDYIYFSDAVALNRLVFLGLQSVRFFCLFVKPCNQSIPAILLSKQILGNLHASLLPSLYVS
jgi:hypothetical protein